MTNTVEDSFWLKLAGAEIELPSQFETSIEAVYLALDSNKPVDIKDIKNLTFGELCKLIRLVGHNFERELDDFLK